MSADEFIVDGDENENNNETNGNGQPEDANNRTFLILASLLTGTLLLFSLCSVGFLLMNRAADRSEAVAAIETQNAVILATNAAVTRTIEAQELAAQVAADAENLEVVATEAVVTTEAVVATEVVLEEATAVIEVTSDSRLPEGLSPEGATATTSALATIAADPILSAAATAAVGTLSANPTLAAAATQGAGGATLHPGRTDGHGRDGIQCHPGHGGHPNHGCPGDRKSANVRSYGS